jgi:hypothetical protein
MPIIKSSNSGEEITVVIFNETELQALIHLLSSVTFVKDFETKRALDNLEDLMFALGVTPDTVFPQ